MLCHVIRPHFVFDWTQIALVGSARIHKYIILCIYIKVLSACHVYALYKAPCRRVCINRVAVSLIRGVKCYDTAWTVKDRIWHCFSKIMVQGIAMILRWPLSVHVISMIFRPGCYRSSFGFRAEFPVRGNANRDGRRRTLTVVSAGRSEGGAVVCSWRSARSLAGGLWFRAQEITRGLNIDGSRIIGVFPLHLSRLLSPPPTATSKKSRANRTDVAC